MEITRVDYIRVPVDDIEAAKQFYGETLGLPRNEHLDHDDWIEYEAANVTLAVMTPHTHEYEFAQLPPATIALGVPDVAAAKAELEAKGLEVGDMWDSGVCNGAGVSDPAGNRILLHHRYKGYDEG
jgi:predicted enzyme related to lactoylglutathione lyase